MLVADFSDRIHRIHGCGGGGAHGGNNGKGPNAGGEIVLDGAAKGSHVHPIGVVVGDGSKTVETQADGETGFGDGHVGLVRSVHPKLWQVVSPRHASFPDIQSGGFPCCRQGQHG